MWRDVASRSVWLSAGSAIGRLLPFLVLISLGRHLPIADFASVGVGFAWTAVAANLTTAGLATVTTQRLALLDRTAQWPLVLRVVRLGCLFSAMLMLGVALAGPEAVSRAFGRVLDPHVVWPALLCGGLWSLVMLAVAICNGQHRARAAAVTLGVGGALQGAGLAAGSAWGASAASVMWGSVFGNALALAWAVACVRWSSPKSRALEDAGSGVETNARFLWSVAWSSVAAASVVPVTFVAGNLVSHTEDGTRQLAAFQALEQIHLLVTFLPSILGQALLPVLAVHLGTGPTLSVTKLVRISLTLAVVGSILAAAIAWQPQWLHDLIGNPALTDPMATRAMLLNASLAVSLTLMGNALAARAQFARATALNLCWAALFLGLAWHSRSDGAAGIQLARLYASWALILGAGATLWFGSPRNRGVLQAPAPVLERQTP